MDTPKIENLVGKKGGLFEIMYATAACSVEICVDKQILRFGFKEFKHENLLKIHILLWNLTINSNTFWSWWMFCQSLISTQSRLVITSSEDTPSEASVLCADAICVEVPTDNIRVGDSVLVLPGETIPIDVSLLIVNEIWLEV